MAYTTINNPSATAFNTKLYSGNSSTQSITGVGFQPDLVWLKERSSTSSHLLQDAVRGANKDLFSDLNSAEESNTNRMKAFISELIPNPQVSKNSSRNLKLELSEITQTVIGEDKIGLSEKLASFLDKTIIEF